MLNTININLKTDIKTDRPTTLPIALKSQDRNNNQFILRFANGGESVTLDDTYTVEVLTKFSKSGTSRLTTAKVRQDYATWEFDTTYITQDETVYNYVYVRKSGGLVVSADANCFVFNVGLSEVDKDAGKVAETYDENYQKYLDEFKGNVDFEEIAQSETERIQAEQARKEAETLREESYEQKVDTAIVEADVVEKVDNKVTELTPQINNLTAQLVQTESEVSKKVGNGKLATMADMGQDVKESMTGGSVAVVGVNTVLTENIVDKQVTPNKTDFATTVLATVNIFNKATVTSGYSLDINNGTLYAKADWITSDFIEVKPSTVYTANQNDRMVEYDENKVFVKSVLVKTITTGATAKYLRVSSDATYLNTLMLVEGSTLPVAYEPYSPKTKINELILDEEEVKPMFFEQNVMKKVFKIDEQNANFIYRDSVNMFDKSTVTPNARLNTNGTTTSRADYVISDYIEVESSTQYAYSYGVEIVQYDVNKNYITGHSGGTAPYSFTTEATTKYIRHSVYLPHLEKFMLVKGSLVPQSYTPYHIYKFNNRIQVAKDVKKFEGKTWNVLGDSITNRSSYCYWTLLRPLLGIATVNNYGVSGSSIAVRSGRTDSMVERYSSMVDADIITLLGGTNDFGSGVPLGEMSDRINTTFYGACHELLSGLVNKYPTKIVAVFTTIPRYNMQEVNSLGLYVHDYMDALMEVAGFYGIASFDILRNSQIRAYNETAKLAYIPDGLHPNNAGYDLMANQMLPLIQGL